MPTAAGTRAYVRRIAESDAASVAMLKNAGAIVLGKTVTTAFAMGDAGPTTNPWNEQHTPGGSSSGSGAAVADRMCMAALGTQTAGSVIRPCSFNGLAGIKPTHGAIDIEGVVPLAWRLDHVGVLARNLADTQLLWRVLSGSAPANIAAEKPQKLWRARGLFESMATPDMQKAMDEHCAALQEAGVEIVERDFPASFDQVLEFHQVIMASEAAASHSENFAARAELYPPKIKALIEEGQGISATDYLAARQHRRRAISDMQAALSDLDGLLSPAAAEAAPSGLDHTGERSFNVPSSYFGLPVVTYPAAFNHNGLPLGMQIMGVAGSEDSLLAVGGWCETLAGLASAPA